MNLYEMFEQETKQPTLIDALRDFLPIAVEHLQLKTLPKIKLKKSVEGKHLPTFGSFSNDDSGIELNIANRHPNDILRTLAHEMVHHKQNELNELDADSWQTGSDAENEANAEAGVIMRLFNKAHPKYLKLKPIMFESVSSHDEPEDMPGMQSTPSDPIPFPKGTTLVNVSDVYDWYKLGMAVSDLDDADPRTFNKGVPHTVFAFGSEEEEAKMIPLLKRLGFSLHDIDSPKDYEKAIRADEAIAFLESYVTENLSEAVANTKFDARLALDQIAKSIDLVLQQQRTTPRLDVTKVLKLIKDAIYESGQKTQTPPGKYFALLYQQVQRVARAEPTVGSRNVGTEARYALAGIRSDTIPTIQQLLNQSVKENFADGKKPGRKGLAKRSGVDCGKSVTDLRNIAKNSSGERQRMAHWCANMKSGRKG